MKSVTSFAAVAATLFVVSASMPAFVQDGSMLYGPIEVIPGVGMIARPASSIPSPETFHTHLQILIPDTAVEAPPRRGSASPPPEQNSSGQTPASMACAYYLVPQTNGCDPYNFFTVASGGSKAVGIVDAYNNPTVVSDLQYFSQYFGLPAPKITVYYCNATECGVTTAPRSNAGWALEEALDVQAVHSMAPGAEIILVEANSNSFTDLFRAEAYAATKVAAVGGGEVSNSWGTDEFSGETTYDSTFVKSGVVFFASAGDQPGVEYPAVSPNVVGVGGTTIVLNGSYVFEHEATWAADEQEAGGGGISAYESRPSYQNAVESQVGGFRGTPDISADANPASGLWVYCSTASCRLSPWIQVGGTSLSAQLLAGMTNNAGDFKTSSTAMLTNVYKNLNSADYDYVTHNDPENPSVGCYNGPDDDEVQAASGWNVCTGVGAPHGLGGL